MFQAVTFTYDVRCLKPGPRSVPRLRSGSSPPVILWLCARTERPLPPGQQRPLVSCHVPMLRSVADPWHFGVDPDRDPRIHACDKWIRMRIRILLFSSVKSYNFVRVFA